MRAATAVSVVLCGVVACTSAGVEHVGRDRAAIVNGSVDAGDPAVVAVVRRPVGCDDAIPPPICSGALVAPRVVLTAAHCIADLGAETALEVFIGGDVSDASGTLDVVIETAVHPKYDPTTHDYDVALLRLADDPKIAPVALGGAPGPVGSVARVVGFGVTGDAGSVPGTKRQGTTKIDSVATLSFTAVPDPSMTCAGDSGGPVFVGGGEAGPEVLVGVTSKGDAACAASAFNVRIDAVRDFVDPFVAATATAPSGPPTGVVPLSVACDATCQKNEDCPDGLVCLLGSLRCGLSGAPPSSFGATCDATHACEPGATCVRVWTSGADACRCSIPCPGAPVVPDGGPPPPDASDASDAASPPSAGDSGGCTYASRSVDAWSFAAWALALAFARARRRRAINP